MNLNFNPRLHDNKQIILAIYINKRKKSHRFILCALGNLDQSTSVVYSLRPHSHVHSKQDKWAGTSINILMPFACLVQASLTRHFRPTSSRHMR